jgi:hypothetical protein
VTRARDGALVTDADQVKPGEEIEARLARGKISASVTASKK